MAAITVEFVFQGPRLYAGFFGYSAGAMFRCGHDGARPSTNIMDAGSESGMNGGLLPPASLS